MLKRLILILLHRISKLLPDKLFLQFKFRLVMNTKLDLKNPKTFNEKLQWLKLYNRKPEYTTMVDKYAVKEYVASKIGEEYIIPTLGVWDTPDDIDWDSLPNQFVLKTTHGGGSCGVVICKDKYSFDKDSAKRVLERSLKSDIFWHYREWPYKNVPKRIIAEQYMTDDKSKDLPDYKFFCFDGEPQYCQVIRDRRSKETIDFYDMEWNHMPFVGLNPVASNGLTPVAKPKHLDKMMEISRKLSEGNPFSRIDLYVINDKEYFGEITFFPASGMGEFRPDEWNNRLGDLINLPNAIGGGKYKCLINDEVLQITNEEEQLKDYKLFCFNGRVEFFKIDFDRFTGHKANYYNREKNLLPFGEVVCPPSPSKQLEMPQNLDQMIILAEQLTKGIPFLRVDFYNINGKIFFGELTFFPASGMGKFEPEEWDYILGKWLELSSYEIS